ncbi:MAG: hypothetical protein Q4P17_04010 [Methanobacterium sp.]|nr:hypothetical protein [Methanobacterium sp.]
MNLSTNQKEILSVIELGFAGIVSIIIGSCIYLTGYGNEITSILGISLIPLGILAIIMFIVGGLSKMIGLNIFIDRQ